MSDTERFRGHRPSREHPRIGDVVEDREEEGDGAHSEEPATADYRAWAHRLAAGGTLAIHDVFEDPADGGRGPFYERATAEGFRDAATCGSLRVLRRGG